MKPAPFDYHAPEQLEDVSALLASLGDEAKLLAGGQSLIPVLALRLSRFEHLIDLGRVEALRGIEREGAGFRIGAMTRQSEIGRSEDLARDVPLLSRATPWIGHFQIRNRGTIGGSIAHADPAAEYPAVAVALDAEMELVRPNGTRRVPARDFFQSTFLTAIAEDEVLSAIHFPARAPRSGCAVEELARRSGDFALAGVACAVELDEGGRIARAAIGLFGLDSVPRRAEAAEKALVGMSPDDLDAEELGRAAVADTNPQDDVHAPGSYRRHIAAGLVGRALGRAIKEARSAG